MDHFGDDMPSQSLDWCKKPICLTKHLAGTSKTKYSQVTTQKPKQQLMKTIT